MGGGFVPVFIVPEEYSGITVRNFLRRHCDVSARLLARLKRTDNGITANGRPVRSIDILSPGDRVELVFPEDTLSVEPADILLDIVYEDSAVLVVDKPPFMPVHPVHDYRTDTLANGVMYHAAAKGESYAFRAVNRLDKDTSGLVLIAKNGYAHTFLSSNTQKTYYALCEGIIDGEGTIDAPIRLKEGHTIQRETGEGGVRAVTHYRVLKNYDSYSLLELRLETGRTHQIRVHLSSLGHPLAGDDMYGGSREKYCRQCLHCGKMEFIHPVSRETIKLESMKNMFELPDKK